jgi:hypothetical protein
MRAKSPLDSERASSSDARCAQFKCANRPQRAMKTHGIAKTHMEWAFPRSREKPGVVDAMQKKSRHPQA